MSATWQAAAALAGREWVSLLRQPAEWLTPLAFVVSVVVLFPLGLGPEPARLRELAPGLLWIAALLASLLPLPRLFAADLADGSLEQWWLAPLPRPLAVALKLAVHWAWTGLPLVLLALVGALNLPVLYFSVSWWNTLHQGASISPRGSAIAPEMLWGLLLATAGFWAYAAAAVLSRARQLLQARVEREALWPRALGSAA